MSDKRWGETPFFEIQETIGGSGTVLKTFPDEHEAWDYWIRLKGGKEKLTWGGDVRLVEVLEIFGNTKFVRHTHTGWAIEDTNHPGKKNNLGTVHLTPDSGYVYDSWDNIINGTGEYKGFQWRGNLKLIRVVATRR